MKKLLLFVSSLLLLTSCDNKIFYEKIAKVPDENWNIDSLLTFNVTIEDSLAFYDIYFDLRNTTDFETQYFYAFMKTTFPSGYSAVDTLGFVICDKYGHWHGKGQGRIKDNQYLFKKKVRFMEKGTYTFSVQQAMRKDDLIGITDFGLCFKKTK